MKQTFFFMAVASALALCSGCKKDAGAASAVAASSEDALSLQGISKPVCDFSASTPAGAVLNSVDTHTTAVFTATAKVPGVVITEITLNLWRSIPTTTPFTALMINGVSVKTGYIPQTVVAPVNMLPQGKLFTIECSTSYGMFDPDGYEDGEGMQIQIAAIKYKVAGITRTLSCNAAFGPLWTLDAGTFPHPPGGRSPE
jgi:hypothetical protein